MRNRTCSDETSSHVCDGSLLISSGARAGAVAVAALGLTIVAWSDSASADPSVVIVSPLGGTYADTVLVSADISSPVSVKTVHAQIESVGLDLPVSTLPIRWEATMNIASLAYGWRTVTVTAEDVNGAIGTASSTFVIDRPPTLAINAPIAGYAVRPSLPLQVSCVDDDPAGCTTVRAAVGATVLATGQNSISTSVTPPTSFEGAAMVVDFTGTDSLGRSVTAQRTVYPENAAGITELLRVPGTLFDFSPTHVVYLNAAGNALLLRNRSTLEDTVIVDALPQPIVAAAIYKNTVVYQKGDRTVNHWKGAGNTAVLGTAVIFPNIPRTPLAFRLAGPYVAFVSVVNTYMGHRPVRHNLDTGAVTIVKGDRWYLEIPPPPSRQARWFDLAPDGSVTYEIDLVSSVFFYRESTGMTQEFAPANGRYYEPLTNGESILMQGGPLPEYAVGVLTPAAGPDYTPLSKGEGRFHGPGSIRAERDYLFGEGWIGYSVGVGGDVPVHVLTRSPAGVTTDCATLNESVALAALSPKGEIAFNTATRRYLASATSLPAQWVSGAQGKVVHRDGEFYVMLGDTLFRMPMSQGDAGTGSPDGGTGVADAAFDVADVSTDTTSDVDASTGGAGGAGTGGAGAGGATTGSGGNTGPGGATGAGGAATGGAAGATGTGGTTGTGGATGAGGSAGNGGTGGTGGATGTGGTTGPSGGATPMDAGAVDASSGDASASSDPPLKENCECGIRSPRTSTRGVTLTALLASAMLMRRRKGKRDASREPNP